MSATKGPASAWAAAIEIVGAFCSTAQASISDFESVIEEATDGVDSKLGPPIIEFLRVARMYDCSLAENHLQAVTRLRSVCIQDMEAVSNHSLSDAAIINAAFERVAHHAIIRVRSPAGYPAMWRQAWSTIVSALDRPTLDDSWLEEELCVVLGSATTYLPWMAAKEVFGGTSHHFSSRIISLRAVTDICLEHMDAWPSNCAMFVRDCRALFSFDWFRVDSNFDGAAKDAMQNIVAFLWSPRVTFDSLEVRLGQLLGADRLRRAPWSVLRDLLRDMPNERRQLSHRMIQDVLTCALEIALDRRNEQRIRTEERCGTLVTVSSARRTRRDY